MTKDPNVKGLIGWFASNHVAANLLMVGILLAGIYTALFRVPLEVTPALNWNVVMIEMPHRGATAKDVETDILIPVEQSLEGFHCLQCLLCLPVQKLFFLVSHMLPLMLPVVLIMIWRVRSLLPLPLLMWDWRRPELVLVDEVEQHVCGHRSLYALDDA